MTDQTKPTKKAPRQTTRSGHRHVFWAGHRGQWYVRVKHGGKHHTAGRYFDDLGDAAAAASALRQSLGITDVDKLFTREPAPKGGS